MGSSLSQEDYHREALGFYNTALQNPCLLPDAGIDDSLLRYSGIDSNTQLQTFSDLQVDVVPDYIEKLGSGLASLSVIPNAVGLGAMVISLIVDLIIKGTPQTDPTYEMLRRVFGEEKASAVRDTMSEYLNRHRSYMKNDRKLLKELQRLEVQLSNQLTILRNSLMHDGQMSTRGFKMWVNGASFHIQMMIHEARLSVKSGDDPSDYVDSISGAINSNLGYLDRLLEKYKTFWMSKTKIFARSFCFDIACSFDCYIENNEHYCVVAHLDDSSTCPFKDNAMLEHYTNVLFSSYEPLSGLKSHFTNIKSNLTILINQHDSFTVPSAARRPINTRAFV